MVLLGHEGAMLMARLQLLWQWTNSLTLSTLSSSFQRLISYPLEPWAKEAPTVYNFLSAAFCITVCRKQTLQKITEGETGQEITYPDTDRYINKK